MSESKHFNFGGQNEKNGVSNFSEILNISLKEGDLVFWTQEIARGTGFQYSVFSALLMIGKTNRQH